MSERQVLEAFDRWRAAGAPLVLVTVTETLGSTYSKAGHRILITGTGEFRGLVSGGCLEGDLAEHARAVLAAGEARLVTYDLRDERDDLWGLGIGCNGLFRLLLQALPAGDGYAPFAAIAERLRSDEPGVTATVVESDDARLPVGATLVTAAGDPVTWQIEEPWLGHLARACRQRTGIAPAGVVRESVDGRGARILYAPLRPLPRLLVLGAGLDAVPLVGMARAMGWRVTVADHRPAYLARGDLQAADEVLQLEPARLGRAVAVERFSAAVVMSHHLETDRAWLSALADCALPYVGLLGPAARGARILEELGPAGAALHPRLHSPVGLPIGADSPESIALAIVAEIHATLAGATAAAAQGR